MAILIVARENIRRPQPLELGRLLFAVVERMESWIERHEQRRDLAELTEAQLKDVGLSAADVARETGKPFWQL